jgi:hypothetical protein
MPRQAWTYLYTVKSSKKREAILLDIKQIKHEYRLRQWAEIVAECQRSGEPVRDWCKDHGICRQTYYNWQKQVREAAIGSAITLREGTPLSSPENAVAPKFARIDLRGSTPTGATAMSIYIGDAECRIMNGADLDVIERALLVLGKTC